MVEYLGDRTGAIFGTISKEGGRFVLKDRFGAVLGYYDPNSDFTYDRMGRALGRGNWLSALLYIELEGRLRW